MILKTEAPKGDITLITDKDKAREALASAASIKAYLNQTIDDLIARDSTPERRKQKDNTERFRRYITSDHDGKIEKGEWVDLSDIGEEYFYDPKINTYLAAIRPQLAQTRTRLITNARKSNEIRFKRVADFLRTEYENWQKNKLTINRRDREITWNLLASGDTYRYTFLNTSKEACAVNVPIEEKTEETTRKRGSWQCPQCQASGNLSEIDMESFGQTVACPQCGYEQVAVRPDISIEVAKTAEYRTESVGEIDFEVPDASEVSVIWTDDEISNALAVIWKREFPRCVVEQTYNTANLPSAEQSEKIDSEPIDTRLNNLMIYRVWLSPSVYQKAKSGKPEEIEVEGQTITINGAEDLIKLFPCGLYIVRAGDKHILQTYEQAIGDCWAHSVNDLGKTGYGTGEWDLLELQFQKNEMRTLRMNKALNDSYENLIAREGYYDEIPNEPGAIVNIKDVPLDIPNERIISRLPPAQFPAESTEMERQIDGDMIARSGAMSASTADVPDMKAVEGTATGFMAWQNHTMERRRPLLERMARNLDVAQFYQFWQAIKDYYSPAAAKEYFNQTPPEVIEWFYTMDVRKDFLVEPVPDSFMPETKEAKQQKMMQRLEMMLPILQANPDPQKIDEIDREIKELFGGNQAIEQEDEQTEAQIRLEKTVEIAQKMEKSQVSLGMGITDANGFISLELVNAALAQVTKSLKMLTTPTDPLADKPVDVLLDTHEEFIDVYQDYLVSAAGRQLSQFTRFCIKTLIMVHSQAAPMKEIYIQSLMNEVMAADVEFQRQQQQMQAEQEMMIAQAGAEQELNNLAAKTQAESQREMVRAGDKATANEILHRQKEMQAEESHQNQMSRESEKQTVQ